MKTENHIIDILQLHEYGMAIGQSLDYKKSCDLFLKILLKRKNLNAAWIIENNQDTLLTTYAIPHGEQVDKEYTADLKKFLEAVKENVILKTSEEIQSIAPIALQDGTITVFNLKEQGYLFLYTSKNNLTLKDVSQLQPVMNKFCVNLKACKAFKEQQNLLKDLEAQNQELSDYAHMVSHDLKSPLRSIEALLSWLKEDYQDVLDDKGNQEIALIGSHLEKMDALISGILHYSSIDRDMRKERPINLNDLLKEILELQHVPQHIQITIKNLPTIKADRFKVQQVFQNLIGNAIANMDKPEGEIKIYFDQTSDVQKFAVSDNGKGINDAYFHKIFQIFQKLENDSASTGIGLSIVKKIVNSYDGTIWLESEEGLGTTFYFTLPQTY